MHPIIIGFALYGVFAMVKTTTELVVGNGMVHLGKMSPEFYEACLELGIDYGWRVRHGMVVKASDEEKEEFIRTGRFRCQAHDSNLYEHEV